MAMNSRQKREAQRREDIVNLLWSRYGNRCFYCGCVMSFDPEDSYWKGRKWNYRTIEHLVPKRELDGDIYADLTNLRLACLRCNHTRGVIEAIYKRVVPPKEFREHLRRYIEIVRKLESGRRRDP